MALTQESILKFLLEEGGKAKNSELLNKFKGLLNSADPLEKKQNRELFKRFVNNLAVVKEIEGVKYVVIKKKYVHLLKGNAVYDAQKSELGETPESPSSSSTPGNALEHNFHSPKEEGKVNIPNSDLDKNNVFTGKSANDDCLNSNVKNPTTGLPLLSDTAAQCSNLDGQNNNVIGSFKSAEKDTSKVKESNLTGEMRSKKTGAVFAIVAVKSQSEQPCDKRKCDELVPKIFKEEKQKPVQKPYMLPLRVPPPQIQVESQAPDKDNRFGKRRQLEETAVPDSPHLRRAYKTTKPGEYSETIPLDTMEHEWLVKSAAGQWSLVYGLLLKDTHLAMKRDFLSGFTALHWAAKSGNSDMVGKIIEISKRGGTQVNVNAKAHGGYTPLHIAALHNQESVMKLLVRDYGANTNLRDNNGKKPCYYMHKDASPKLKELLGAPQVLHQEESSSRHEDDYFQELPKGLNTLSKLFQPYVGHKKKHKQRPGFYSASEDQDSDNASKRRPLSDMFL